MQKSRNSQAFWLLLVPSVLLFLASLNIAIHIRYPNEFGLQWPKHVRAFGWLYLVWLIVMFAHNLFDIRILRRYIYVFFSLVSASVFNFLAAVVYFYYQPDLILTPRRFLILDIGITFALLLGWYLLVKTFFARRSPEQIYFFGESGQHLADEIVKHKYLGYEFAGYLTEQDLAQKSFAEASIILPDAVQSRPDLLSQFYNMRKHLVGFYNQHDFYERLTRRVDLSNVSELWFLENVNYQSKRLYSFAKRAVDVVFGLAMGAIFIVTFPIIAIIIKATSRGSLFFVQDRVGKDGTIFRVYKYRTMVGSATDTWTMEKDPRITKVGKFLRRTRLDELPQFVNLLQGNMSLVGPRPEQVHIVARLATEIPFFDERHVVKPGLTGWAQLNIYASNLAETKRKLQYDLYYIKHQSILFDLEIILKTAYHVFVNRGR